MRIKGSFVPMILIPLGYVLLLIFMRIIPMFRFILLPFHTYCITDRLPMAKINVQDTEITVISHNDDDYISLTDMARSQLQEHIIFRWLSLKSTIEYLGEWEMLYNPNFNCTEFGTFRNMAGSNNFVLSVKTWIEKTNPSENVRMLG